MGAASRVCTSCDTPLPDDAAFCPTCGAATVQPPKRLTNASGDVYELRGLVSRGEVADVYRARDVTHDRDVAIKLFDRYRVRAGSTTQQRLMREAQILVRSVRHPAILAIEHAEVWGTQLFFVMPWIQGESLRSYLIRDGPLSMSNVARLASHIAVPLQAAHDASIVHRNLKPENVLLEDTERRVVLADFVGRQQMKIGLDDRDPVSPIDLRYASPEQIRGTACDGRSDLYSLGCMVYEMLVGSPPFTGGGSTEVAIRHIVERPPQLTENGALLRGAFAEVIDRALAKNPGDRFATVTAFAEALARADPRRSTTL